MESALLASSAIEWKQRARFGTGKFVTWTKGGIPDPNGSGIDQAETVFRLSRIISSARRRSSPTLSKSGT